MKICIISDLYNACIKGGTEVYVEKIITELSKKGHEVSIITTGNYTNLNSLKPHIELTNNIKLYRFYPLNISSRCNITLSNKYLPLWYVLNYWNLHSYFMIKEILKKERPDVVHTHNLVGLSIGATFPAIKNLNLPLVHTCHDHSMICPYSGLTCSFSKWENCGRPIFPCKIYRKINSQIIGSKPDIVTASSKFVLDNHIAAGFFKESKKIVLPLGIELDTSGSFSNKNYNIENFNILYVGSLSKIKGVYVLIEAFKKILHENVKLHIVGGGDHTSKLRRLAKGDDRIIFHGRLHNEEVRKFYKMANITVVPSICHETFSIVTCEALMSGTPVIGSKIGNIPILIKDGYNGFLFEPGNVKQLKEILENIIENPEQLEELSKNAFESVKQYDMNKHIENLIEIYKEAIELNNLKNDK